MAKMNVKGVGGPMNDQPTGGPSTPSPSRGGLRGKIDAALERANAGRQAKLGAKSDVAYAQGNAKKGAKLEMRSKKVALRSEKRQTIKDAKNTMKVGKALGGGRPETGELNFNNTPRIVSKLTRIETPMKKLIEQPAKELNKQ